MAETEATPVPAPRPSALKELFGRGRLKLMLSILVLELAIFFAAMAVPVNPASDSNLLNQASTISGIAKNPNQIEVFFFILTNNAMVALLEFLPIVGALWWILVTYTTGQLIQFIAASYGLPGILVGYLLFLFPFVIVELSAYAVAVGSGVMLLVAWRRNKLKEEARVLILEVALVLGILVTAAAMETATIASPTLGIAMWIPIVGGLILVLRYSRRRVL
jgi:stage II sporulation SpoM-like protein